jgi:coenzyme F420-dependent glucose-6-phosphate dehydrogenase
VQSSSETDTVFHAPGHDQRRFLDLFKTDLEQRLRRLG